MLHSVVHKKASIFLKPSVVILSPCQIMEHCLLYECFKAIILNFSPDDRKCAVSSALLPQRQSCSRPCSLVDHLDEMSVSSFHTVRPPQVREHKQSSSVSLSVASVFNFSRIESIPVLCILRFLYLSLRLSFLCCHGNLTGMKLSES